MGLVLRVGNWLIAGRRPGQLRFIRDNGLELLVPYDDPAEVRLGDLLCDVSILEKVLSEGSVRAEGSRFTIELRRERAAWKLKASGDIEYEVELTTGEALLIALELYRAHIRSFFEEELRSRGYVRRGRSSFSPAPLRERTIGRVLKGKLSEARLRDSGATATLRIRGKRFFMRIEEPGTNEVLRLFHEVARAIEPGGELPVSDALAAGLLLGKRRLDSVKYDAAGVCVRRYIVRQVFKGKLRCLKFRGDRVIVRSRLGRWAISLRTGSVRLWGYPICIVPPIGRFCGVIWLPGIGSLELDPITALVLNAISMALSPDAIRDEEIRWQIRMAITFARLRMLRWPVGTEVSIVIRGGGAARHHTRRA